MESISKWRWREGERGRVSGGFHWMFTKFPRIIPGWAGLVRCVSVGLACWESVQRQRDGWGKERGYKGMYMMSPKGHVNCEFLCHQFDGVLVPDLAGRIWSFPPPPRFFCYLLFIFLQSNKDAEIWRIPMGVQLFRYSIALWREMEEVVRVGMRRFVRKAWASCWDDCETAQLGTVPGSCLARVVSESSHPTVGSKCVTELCLWLKDSLSYICCLSPTYGGDRDLCFGGRGSLGELSALIWTDEFVGWRWRCEGSEAARRTLGSSVQVCRQVWLGWVMACQEEWSLDECLE